MVNIMDVSSGIRTHDSWWPISKSTKTTTFIKLGSL